MNRRPITVLDQDEVERIHNASLAILERVGVEMLDDEALSVLAVGGATVDLKSKRVRFPRGLVDEVLAGAPGRFSVRGRNPARDLEIGGESIVLIPTGGPTMVHDLDGGRRLGTFDEQVNFIKLSQQSHLLDTAYRCVEAQDLPVATRHLDYLYAAIRYCDKPLVAPIFDRTSALDSLALASALFGDVEELRKRPGVMTVVNVDSPLRFCPSTAQTIVSYARAGQPVQITPFILPGIMSPVTAAGSVAQQNAENLAGITLAQLVRRGAPVVYGSFATHADMRTAAPVFGSAEGVMMEVAAGQLAQRYGIPHRGMGLVTTAHAPDAHAAWEKMNCLWGLCLSNTQVILHAAGWLEGGLTASYEQFVLDLEMLDGMAAFGAGFTVDDRSLAMETIEEIGPGGNYMLTDHTLTNFRLSCYFSTLVDSRAYDTRLSGGGRTLLQRANAVWKQRLAEYEEPSFDSSRHEAVLEYITRRRRGEPATNLSYR